MEGHIYSGLIYGRLTCAEEFGLVLKFPQTQTLILTLTLKKNREKKFKEKKHQKYCVVGIEPTHFGIATLETNHYTMTTCSTRTKIKMYLMITDCWPSSIEIWSGNSANFDVETVLACTNLLFFAY